MMSMLPPRSNAMAVIDAVVALGFRPADVFLIHLGRSLSLHDSEALGRELRDAASSAFAISEGCSSFATLRLTVVLKPAVAAVAWFRVKASSSNTAPSTSPSPGTAVVGAGAGWTVGDLAQELEARGLGGARAAGAMRLVLKGKAMAARDLVGEYTGTLDSAAGAPAAALPLLVLSQPFDPTVATALSPSPDDLTVSLRGEPEVRVGVRLPNGKRAAFDVGPGASLLAVKGLVARTLGAPLASTRSRSADNDDDDDDGSVSKDAGAEDQLLDLDSFELFCAVTRQPLPAARACAHPGPRNPLVRALECRFFPPTAAVAQPTQPSIGSAASDSTSNEASSSVVPCRAECNITVAEALRRIPSAVVAVPLALTLKQKPGVSDPTVPGRRGVARAAAPQAATAAASTARELELLLLPSVPLPLPPLPVGPSKEVGSDTASRREEQDVIRVTTFDQLDKAYPVSGKHAAAEAKPRAIAKKTARKGVSADEAVPASFGSTSAAKEITSVSANCPGAPVPARASAFVPAAAAAAPAKATFAGHKPSRPCAHPKERVSKARATFAGLRKGFFSTPEKTLRPSPDTPESPPPTPPGASSATSASGTPAGAWPISATALSSAAAAAAAAIAACVMDEPLSSNPLPSTSSSAAEASDKMCDPRAAPETSVATPSALFHARPAVGIWTGRTSGGSDGGGSESPAACLSPPAPRAPRPLSLRPLSWAAVAPRSPAGTDSGAAGGGPKTLARNRDLLGLSSPAHATDRRRTCPQTPPGLVPAAAVVVASANTEAAAAVELLASPPALLATVAAVAPRTPGLALASSPSPQPSSEQKREATARASWLTPTPAPGSSSATADVPSASPDHARGAPRSALNPSPATSVHTRAGRLAAALDRCGGQNENVLHGASSNSCQRGGAGAPASAEKASPPHARCGACSRRLKPWDAALGPCRCGASFCGRHHHAASHACAFDFAGAELARATPAAVPLLPAKLQRI